MGSSETASIVASLPEAALLFARAAFLGARRRFEAMLAQTQMPKALLLHEKEGAIMSITSDLIRGHTETIILAQLAVKDSYGYEINKTIQEVTDGAYELKEATLYSAFRRLESNGMIRSYWGDQTTGARRRYYTITESGRSQLEQNRKEWTRSKQLIDRMILGGRMMEEKLRQHVMSLFDKAPKNKKTIEIREEILANVRERFRDLIAAGATPEEAYDISIRSIGDIDEILRSLEDVETAGPSADTPSPVANVENRKKKAALDAIAVALYIVSPVFLIFMAAVSDGEYWIVGLTALFICVAVATALKIYANRMYNPQVLQGVDKEVKEEFEAWYSGQEPVRRKMQAYSGILWTLVVVVYFVISFATGAWYISWVIFLIGAALEQIIKLNVQK